MNQIEPFEELFWDRLYAYIDRNHLNGLFQEPETIRDKVEPVYFKARELLGEEDGDDLVLYVAACEEYCRTYALAAYKMGLEDAKSILVPTDQP